MDSDEVFKSSGRAEANDLRLVSRDLCLKKLLTNTEQRAQLAALGIEWD